MRKSRVLTIGRATFDTGCVQNGHGGRPLPETALIGQTPAGDQRNWRRVLLPVCLTLFKITHPSHPFTHPPKKNQNPKKIKKNWQQQHRYFTGKAPKLYIFATNRYQEGVTFHFLAFFPASWPLGQPIVVLNSESPPRQHAPLTRFLIIE
jgi:hypothetical protein